MLSPIRPLSITNAKSKCKGTLMGLAHILDLFLINGVGEMCGLKTRGVVLAWVLVKGGEADPRFGSGFGDGFVVLSHWTAKNVSNQGDNTKLCAKTLNRKK